MGHLSEACSHYTCASVLAHSKTIYMTFKDLNITEPILKAIEEKGYANPTPIQVKAIPAALTGKDILGCGRPELERPLHLHSHYSTFASP